MTALAWVLYVLLSLCGIAGLVLIADAQVYLRTRGRVGSGTPWGEFADSDSRTATIRNEIIDGTKNPRAETERGSGLVGGTGASVLSNQKRAPNTSRPLGGASR